MVKMIPGDEAYLALAQTISDAIADGQESGMETWEAINMALIAVTDYARAGYGDGVLEALSGTVMMRKGKPLPKIETNA